MVVGGASGIGWATAQHLAAGGWRVVVADIDAAAAGERAHALSDGAAGAHVDVTDETSVESLMSSAATAGELQLVVKHAGQHLSEGGSVVSVASLNARQPGIGMGAYCAAKAGLVMLTEVAALELSPKGIRVNTVSPGLVPTPLTAPALEIPGIEDDYLENTPLGRAGSVGEVAYLADAHWVTGTNLDINGGAHLKRYPDIHGHVMRAFS